MEPNESLIRALVSQGGFALLAAAFGYLSYKGAQMWVNDVKAAGERERALTAASAERERLLTERVLQLMTAITESLANNNSAISTLRLEIEGLRGHFHNFRNSLAVVQASVENAAGLRATGKNYDS